MRAVQYEAGSKGSQRASATWRVVGDRMIQDMILNFLRRPMSLSELAKKTGKTRDFVKGYLVSMEERNLVTLDMVGRSLVVQKRCLHE